jgi:hypothetical protein
MISYWMSILFSKLCYKGAQLFLYYSSLTSKNDFTYVIMFCKVVHQFHLFFEKATHAHTHTNELPYTQCLGKHSSWHPLVCIAYTVSIFSSHHAKLCYCGHSSLSVHFLVFVKCSPLPLPVLFITDGSVIPGCTYSHPSARICIKNFLQVIGLVAGDVLSMYFPDYS